MWFFVAFASFVLFFAQCKSDKSAAYQFGELNPQNIENQSFRIKIGKDTVLKTRGGVILTLCPNTFLGKNGQEVEVVVQEILNKKDLVQSGIPTIADDGRLLETGGMLRVTTIPDLKINPDCPINAKVPTSLKTKNMQLFVADVENGEIEWKLVGPLEQPKIPENLMNGERLFLKNCASCHCIDEPEFDSYTEIPLKTVDIPLEKAKTPFGDTIQGEISPDNQEIAHSETSCSNMLGRELNCISEYRTRDWLVKYTQNPQKMALSKDKIAQCIQGFASDANGNPDYSKGLPSRMPSFENLSEKQINDIFDYINAARNRDCDCKTIQCNSKYSCTIDSGMPVKFQQPTDYLYFQFSIKDKQTINIDAFMDQNEPKVEPFLVNFNTEEPLEAYLIFQDRNSLCPLVKEGNRYIMMNGRGKTEANLPVGEEVKIIAFTRDRAKPRRFVEKMVTIGKQNRHDLNLEEISKDEFQKMLKEEGFVESCCQFPVQTQG